MSSKVAGHDPERGRIAGLVHSTRVHLVLYSLLLVGTPFLMLRAYMQDAIGQASAASFAVWGTQVPYAPVVGGGVVLFLLALFRPRITLRRIAAAAAGVALIGLAQQVTDYYFGHAWYELQFNWHYLAYGTFAFMVYRDMAPRQVPLARCLLVTAGATALFSSFDEAFQLVVNNRVFDMSDIAKDYWGSFTGMTMLLVGKRHPELAGRGWRQVRHCALGGYLRSPSSVWLLVAASASFFVVYGSLLSDPRFALTVAGLTIGSTLLFFAVLHFSQRRWIGRTLAGLGVAAVVALGVAYALNRHDPIGAHRFGLTVCRGIPVPFFDVMVFPDGSFRLVDKKHYFNGRDRDFFLEQIGPDILVIGAGYEGKGGSGFPHQRGSGFMFNRFTGRGTQIVILESGAACDYYERLKEQGKHVLLVLHTTC